MTASPRALLEVELIAYFARVSILHTGARLRSE